MPFRQSWFRDLLNDVSFQSHHPLYDISTKMSLESCVNGTIKHVSSRSCKRYINKWNSEWIYKLYNIRWYLYMLFKTQTKYSNLIFFPSEFNCNMSVYHTYIYRYVNLQVCQFKVTWWTWCLHLLDFLSSEGC